MTMFVPKATFECENMNVVCFGDEDIHISVSINIANCWNADSILSLKNNIRRVMPDVSGPRFRPQNVHFSV